METDATFEKLVDDILRDFSEYGLPQRAPFIAETLAEVFCRGFAPHLRAQYVAEMETYIRGRLDLFLLAAKAGQN